MKPAELRIGNYIQNRRGIVFKIETLSNFLTTENHSFQYEDVHPIPLTEQWLLKFGFEAETFRLDKRVFYQKNKFMYNTGSKTLCYDGSNMAHIKYVHQIQNLYFALTGEELEYNAL